MADESVHCVVTSPPYYGLRDYGIEPQVWGGEPGCEHDFDIKIRPQIVLSNAHTTLQGGQSTQASAVPASESGFCRHCNAWRGSLGLEPTPALYIEHMAVVFREIRRVLRKDGTLWLNLGDGYAGGSGGDRKIGEKDETRARKRDPIAGYKPKDLLGMPWAVAFALRDDGWWLRSESTWAKLAPMPESCRDRPTMATEKVFLLTKSARYFYDVEAVKEEQSEGTLERFGAAASSRINPGTRVPGRREYNPDRQGEHNLGAGASGKRNMRNFLLLGPSPFPGAHFATFHPRIPEIAILAGTSARGVCPKCGAGWERVIDNKIIGRRDFDRVDHGNMDDRGVRVRAGESEKETIGWRPTCSCDAGDPVPSTILDCFLGSGTTALVADRLGRHCIGIELSPKYAAMAERRIRDDAGMFANLAAE